MTYILDWSNPSKGSITLPDTTVDTTSTSLTLYGLDAPNYGEGQQENFIRMLENFASDTPPPRPTFTISSNAVTEGASVTVTGTNIPPGSQVLVQYTWNGGPETALATPSFANSNGVWTHTQVASPAGTYVLKAYMNTAANPGAWHYVSGATTTLQVNPV